MAVERRLSLKWDQSCLHLFRFCNACINHFDYKHLLACSNVALSRGGLTVSWVIIIITCLHMRPGRGLHFHSIFTTNILPNNLRYKWCYSWILTQSLSTVALTCAFFMMKSIPEHKNHFLLRLHPSLICKKRTTTA